jgi:hypothetical protein
MFRQLDQRHSQQATVTLEWDPATGNVQVRFEDHSSSEESFSYSVDPENARLAFLHPFALRPSQLEHTASPQGPQHGTSGMRQ